MPGDEGGTGQETVAAEVVPANSEHAVRAARALQQRGFRILHIGGSISVEAPRSTWEQHFGVTFTPRSKQTQAGIGRRTEFLHARPESLHVPDDLGSLIADVAFVEPPDLH